MGFNMIRRITSAGKCLAIILPRDVAKELGLGIGDYVQISSLKKIEDVVQDDAN
jgi:antitoxin component of MazEF toxin-antitoxin module